jgi:hypothetical protein
VELLIADFELPILGVLQRTGACAAAGSLVQVQVQVHDQGEKTDRNACIGDSANRKSTIEIRKSSEHLAVYHYPIDGVAVGHNFFEEGLGGGGDWECYQIRAGFGEDAAELAWTAQGAGAVEGGHFDGVTR